MVEAIRVALTARGYTVLRVGQRNARLGGSDAGVPDLLVTRTTWPRYLLAGLEVKGPKTRVSEQQQRLAAAGRIAVVRSVDEALAALEGE